MDAVTDPIHILLCGGFDVGKTTLLSRLSNFAVIPFQRDYVPSAGLNRATFDLPLSNGTTVRIHLYDVSAELMISPVMLPRPLVQLINRCEGILVVTDPLRKACATWTDITIDILQRLYTRQQEELGEKGTTFGPPHYLLVNKSDVTPSEHVISARQFDKFVAHSDQLVNWFYTVGHPALGDVDFSRGYPLKQKPIEDVLRRLVMDIVARRPISIRKLLMVPMQIRFLHWKHVAVEDLIDLI
jgi:hypothetical protein